MKVNGTVKRPAAGATRRTVVAPRRPSPLAPAAAVYACAGGPPPTGHPAAHAGFARLCRALRELDRVLGDGVSDPYWADLRSAARRYRFRAAAAPLTFDNAALGIQDVAPTLATQYARCALRDPSAAPHARALIDGLAALSTSGDAPLLDVVAALVAEALAVEAPPGGEAGAVCAVAVPDTRLIGPSEHALAGRGLGGLPVVGPAQLRGAQCFGTLVVVGPPHWYPEYVVEAPRARQTRVVAYPWMTLPDGPPPLFRARWSSAPVSTEAGRAPGADAPLSGASGDAPYATPHAPLLAIHAPLAGWRRAPGGAEALPCGPGDGEADRRSDAVEVADASHADVPPWLDAAGWVASAMATAPARPGYPAGSHSGEAGAGLDAVRALPVLLDGNAAVFLDAEDGATVLVIDLNEVGRRRVRRVPADLVEEGMFVLLRAGGGGDYVPLVADALLGGRAAEPRRMQAAWKQALRAEVQRTNLFEASIALLDLGAQRANEGNVRRWIWARSIRPHSVDDFRAIMRLAGRAGETDAYWAGMRLLDRAHARAGQVIRSRLLEQVHASDLAPLERLGRMEFDLPGAHTGRMVACRVLAVPSQPVFVAHSDAGRLLDLDAVWRA